MVTHSNPGPNPISMHHFDWCLKGPGQRMILVIINNTLKQIYVNLKEVTPLQVYPIKIHVNLLQFCPSMPYFAFPVFFFFSFSKGLSRSCDISVNSLTSQVQSRPKDATVIIGN